MWSQLPQLKVTLEFSQHVSSCLESRVNCCWFGPLGFLSASRKGPCVLHGSPERGSEATTLQPSTLVFYVWLMDDFCELCLGISIEILDADQTQPIFSNGYSEPASFQWKKNLVLGPQLSQDSWSQTTESKFGLARWKIELDGFKLPTHPGQLQFLVSLDSATQCPALSPWLSAAVLCCGFMEGRLSLDGGKVAASRARLPRCRFSKPHRKRVLPDVSG